MILIVIAGIYLFTRFLVTKEGNNNEISINEGKVDYNKLIVGSILNQNYDDYYVFIYDGNDSEAIYYSSIVDKYMAIDMAKKVYWVDLSNALNEKFVAKNEEEVNLKAKSISEFKFGEYTLLKIKDNKVDKYIDNINDAKKELKIND